MVITGRHYYNDIHGDHDLRLTGYVEQVADFDYSDTAQIHTIDDIPVIVPEVIEHRSSQIIQSVQSAVQDLGRGDRFDRISILVAPYHPAVKQQFENYPAQAVMSQSSDARGELHITLLFNDSALRCAPFIDHEIIHAVDKVSNIAGSDGINPETASLLENIGSWARGLEQDPTIQDLIAYMDPYLSSPAEDLVIQTFQRRWNCSREQAILISHNLLRTYHTLLTCRGVSEGQARKRTFSAMLNRAHPRSFTVLRESARAFGLRLA